MKKFLLLFLIFLSSCSFFEKKQEIKNQTEVLQKYEDKLIVTGKILEFNPKNLDFKSDDSITKFVGKEISFTNLKYEPNDLVFLSGNFIIDTKGNQTLRLEAFEKLDKLSKDFYNDLGVKLKIVSAYRSYNHQVGIKLGGCGDNFCAKPGFSEHQSGLAFDMFETTNKEEFLKKYKKYFHWMSKNAYKYGFHNSYSKGKEIDGYEIEPWHWRYVGVDFAKYLWENNLTFGEFYYLK